MKRSIRDSPEFDPDWDVFRNARGEAVTITEEQMYAIWRAIAVVERVRSTEQYQSLWTNPGANLYKSRLLGRILLDGKPPTRTKPPRNFGGPSWKLLPGGDPFADTSVASAQPGPTGSLTEAQREAARAWTAGLHRGATRRR